MANYNSSKTGAQIDNSVTLLGDGASLTDGAVLLGSGASAITPVALADNEFLVGQSSGDPAAEDPATARTSLGLPTAGSVVQVVSVVKTDVQTITTTGTDISGFTLNITPSSASNKILIMAHITYDHTGSQYAYFLLQRGGSSILLGDAAGNRARATVGARASDTIQTRAAYITYLDSPASVSQQSYTIEVNGVTINSANSFVINMGRGDSDNTYVYRGTCSMVAMEIAG